MIDDDILKHAHKVDMRATALAEDMARELRASQAAILGKLASLAGEADKAFDELPLARRKALLEAQSTAIDGVLAEVYAKVGENLKAAGEDVIGATMTSTATAMASATGGAALTVGTGLSTDVVAAWFSSSTVDGLLINDFLAKLQGGARDRILSAGRRALIEGKGVQAAARMIREEGIEGSVPGMEGLARTWLHSAASYAREEVVQTHFSTDVTGWCYLATLDGRTCPVCGADDGKTFALAEAKPTLPRHWRCRCIYAPLSRTWRDLGIDTDEAQEAERPAVKHDARTVHHRDGSTSTDFKVREVEHTTETYNEWLTRQLDEDPVFVRQVLGKTRFELFKAGKLKLNQMSTVNRIRKLS